MSDQIQEFSQRYDIKCADKLQKNGDDGKPLICEVDLPQIDTEVKSPVMVYYQLDNFYQNHRRYVKSRDNDQLNGKYLPVDQLSDCDPIKKVEDLWLNQKKNLNGVQLADSEPAIPCGLVAKSFFNDTYELWMKGTNGEPDKNITIIDSNIAWSSDINYKFSNIKEDLPEGKTWKDVQWTNMEDGK